MARYAKKEAVWQPVQLREEITIKGGLMRRAHVVAVKELAVDDAPVKFVQVGSGEAWLCEMVAGQVAARRPLSRCKLFCKLRQELEDASKDFEPVQAAPAVAGGGGDKMASLSFDDEGDNSQSSDSLTPVKKYKRSPKKLQSHDVAAVTVSSSASAVAEKRSVLVARALGRESGKLYVQLDALSWVVNYLRDEFLSGGVSPVEVAAGDKGAPARVWWDFRDECWRSRGAGKKFVSHPVLKRMRPGQDLAHLEFEEAKQIVYNEAIAALDAQSDGEDVGGEDAGAASDE